MVRFDRLLEDVKILVEFFLEAYAITPPRYIEESVYINDFPRSDEIHALMVIRSQKTKFSRDELYKNCASGHDI